MKCFVSTSVDGFIKFNVLCRSAFYIKWKRNISCLLNFEYKDAFIRINTLKDINIYHKIIVNLEQKCIDMYCCNVYLNWKLLGDSCKWEKIWAGNRCSYILNFATFCCCNIINYSPRGKNTQNVTNYRNLSQYSR